MSGKKQVWLQKRSCFACRKTLPHDGHIYHLLRYATVDQEDSSKHGLPFHSYFYCEGLAVPPPLPTPEMQP